MRVTVEMLKDRRACKPQLDLFIRLGLDGAEVTEELCVRHAQDFNWSWAARELLSRAQRTEYYRAAAPAMAGYLRIAASARTERECGLIRAKAFYAASMLPDGGYDA